MEILPVIVTSQLVLLDYGVYALVVQQIILAGVGTVLLWYGTFGNMARLFSRG